MTLFVRSPGEILYFFAVIAVSMASLLMVIGQRLRRPQDRTIQRFTVALLGIILAWLVLMLGALITLFYDVDAVTVLPPLERFAGLCTLLLAIWAFNQPPSDFVQRKRLNFLVGVLMIVMLVGYGYTALEWADLAGQTDFNTHDLGAVWTFAAAVLSLIGLVSLLLTYRNITDVPIKVLFFVILLVGYGGTLVQISEGNIIGDYAGPIRLAFIGAITVLPVIVFRVVMLSHDKEIQAMREIASQQSVRQQPKVEAAPPAPIRSTSTPVEREAAQLLRVLGLVIEEATAATIPERIVKAVIEVLKADVVAILNLQDANYADVGVAYNRVLEKSISGIALNLDHQPTLVNSIERLVQRPLFVDRNQQELQDLYTRLDIEEIGPVYFQPLTRSKKLVAVLMVGMPYANRELLAAEEDLLKGIAVMAGSLLAVSYAAEEARYLTEERTIEAMVSSAAPLAGSDASSLATRQKLHDDLRLAREQITQLSKQVLQLKTELDAERSRLISDLDDESEDLLSISQQMRALTDDTQQLRAEQSALNSALQEAEVALQGALEDPAEGELRDMVEILQREREDLLRQRETLQSQLDGLRDRQRGVMPEDVQKIVARLTQEKQQLQTEHDSVRTKLAEIRSQLKATGVEEGPAGFVQLIHQLTEQRSVLQAQNMTLTQKLEALIAERKQWASKIQQEAARETRLMALEKAVKNLAGDREAIIKQRDALHTQYTTLVEQVDKIKEHRTRLMAQSVTFEEELKEAHTVQARLREEIWRFANERSDLLNERDRLVAEKQALEMEREQLIARVDGDRERIETVGSNGVGELTRMVDELTQERTLLEHSLNEAQARMASLENELERVQVSSEASDTYRANNPDLLVGLVQELRTPLTSIQGYNDLLLGESAGILGEMQRSFLQRVAANITRLNGMLDDLVKVTAIDAGDYDLQPGPVDIANLVEDAISNAATQFREKSLAINLQIDDDISMITVDRDAVSQVINQLLGNAYLVSPPKAVIAVSVQACNMAVNDQQVGGVCVSVQDRGGGIASEDAERVFGRRYRADNPLIQGVGDTGVGLAVAKALVEAQGGKMWLETEDNIGTTYFFALPAVVED